MMLSLVEKEVGFGDLVTLLRLQADNVSIEEITLPEYATAVGKTLAEIPLPENSHVMAIINPETGLSVAGATRSSSAGDELLMFSDGGHENEVREALGIAVSANAGPNPPRSQPHTRTRVERAPIRRPLFACYSALGHAAPVR